MFNLIRYPAVLLIASLLMGHTIISSDKNEVSTEKALPYPRPKFSTNNKISSSLFAKADQYYTEWNLCQAGLSENAFNYALKGYDYLSKHNLLSNTNIITIVDFSKSSTQKRLYVLDILNGKILYNTLVAHGRNSGNEYANQFSNLPESYQTSLGFYITQKTYHGCNGYSLKLQGCEKGINDKAMERAIVMHGADYVSNSFINSCGRLGRSYGCPSVPAEISKEIIDVVKNGSCLFLYHPSKKYIDRSKIINS